MGTAGVRPKAPCGTRWLSQARHGGATPSPGAPVPTPCCWDWRPARPAAGWPGTARLPPPRTAACSRHCPQSPPGPSAAAAATPAHSRRVATHALAGSAARPPAPGERSAAHKLRTLPPRRPAAPPPAGPPGSRPGSPSRAASSRRCAAAPPARLHSAAAASSCRRRALLLNLGHEGLWEVQ